MTTRRGVTLLLLLLAVIGAGCDKAREVTAATEVVEIESVPAVAESAQGTEELPVITVSDSEPIEVHLLIDSHLMVEQNVGVTSRRDGIVEEIHHDRGDHVGEGDPLVTLEREDLLLTEQTAVLELEREESSWGRARSLFEQKVISIEEFETARLRRDATEKSLERIRYELSKSIIRAPFDGVVSGRYVEKGQVVMEDDRMTLFQVTALSPLLARIYIPEWALFGLSEQRTIIVHPNGGRVSGVEGKIKWLSPVVDAASGSVEALVELTSHDGAGIVLRPGMSVEIDLSLAFAGTSIPLRALSEENPEIGQEYNLRVLNASGVAQHRTVRLGIVGASRAEVREGIEAGERVVLAR